MAAPTAVHSTAASPEHAARAMAAMPNEFLSFRLCGEEYGIYILRVQDIRSYEAPTGIANAAPFIKGVVNEHWFQTLDRDRVAITDWRKDYYEVRPHSSTGLEPVEPGSGLAFCSERQDLTQYCSDS